jgi:hypothetical protein
MADVTLLELVPILLAFYTWRSKQSLKRKQIVINCDNMSLVQTLTSRNLKVMILLVLLLLYYNNIQIKAIHIVSRKNDICDAISRLQFRRLQNCLPVNASKTPLSIPFDFQQFINMKSFDW